MNVSKSSSRSGGFPPKGRGNRWISTIKLMVLLAIALASVWRRYDWAPQLETSSLLLSTTTIAEQQMSTFETMICMEVGDSKKRYRPSPSETDRCLFYVPPSKSFQLLMNVLVGLPNAGRCDFSNPGCTPPHKPYDPQLRHFGDDWPPYGFTMVGKERLLNFWSAIQEVNRNHIPGAICEFGVWRGGSMMLATAIMEEKQTLSKRRDLYLFDAFGSFGGYGKHDDFLAVPLDRVKDNFRMVGLDPDQPHIHFVKGMFQDTTKDWINRSDPIAVLRVDGNFYDSYQDVLYAVYENVPLGGIVIFDDIYHPAHANVLKCWQDFRTDHGLIEELVRIDTASAWFRKKKEVKIDQSKRRIPPTH